MSENVNNHDSHQRWDELAVGYAMSALEPDELDQFIRHLVARCPQCAQSVSDSDEVGAAMNALLAMTAPRAGHRSDVLAAAFAARPPVPQTTADLERSVVEFGDRPLPAPSLPARPVLRPIPAVVDEVVTDTPSEQRSISEQSAVGVASDPETVSAGPRHLAPGQDSDTGPLDELSARRNRRLASRTGRILVAAASLVAVLALITSVVAIRSRDDAQNLADRRQQVVTSILAGGSGRVVALRSVNGNSGSAIVVARADSISVVPDGIDANSRSNTYVLWGIASTTSEPVALGTFDVTNGQVSATKVGSSASGYGSYGRFAISEEPGHTAPAQPTKIVSASQA